MTSVLAATFEERLAVLRAVDLEERFRRAMPIVERQLKEARKAGAGGGSRDRISKDTCPAFHYLI